MPRNNKKKEKAKKKKFEITDELAQAITQALFPKVIRISKLDFGIEGNNSEIRQFLQEAIRTSLQEYRATLGGLSRIDDEHLDQESLLDRHYKNIAEVCTHLWRLQNKLLGSDNKTPLPGLERAYRHLEAAQDTLRRLGYRVVDHTGESYKEGTVLKVLDYEKVPDLNHEKIVETIKPSVFFGDKQIQIGEVIVGVPENKQK